MSRPPVSLGRLPEGPEGRGAAAWSLRHRILSHLLFLLAVAGGWMVFRDTIVDVYPEVSFDQAQILTVWPGAAPEEVEASVTRKIEEEILDLNGIDRIVSNSERDRSLIDVKFREDQSDEDFKVNFEDLRAKVAQVRDLPAEVEPPVVSRISTNELYPLLQIVVVERGDVPFATLRAIARDLRRHLLQVDGVLKIREYGIPDPEWKIRVDEAALEAADLDLLTLARTLRARHVDLPAGSLEAGTEEITVRAAGEFRTPEALARTVVAWRDGASPIRLEDVAEVSPGFERITYANRFDGRECISLGVAKRVDADALTVRAALAREIGRYRETASLPADVEIRIALDTTRIIEDRLRILAENLGVGIVLVLVVLWIFLGAKNSLLALVGIPFSFLLAFLMLAPMGITINALTLFSFVLISGMVVDDAVVVLENVYRHVERGSDLLPAILHGTREVFWPVIASTLTTLAAFLPMLIMEGVVGEFMSIIPKTVAAVLVASIVECLFMLPAHYVHFGSRRARADHAVGRLEAVGRRLTDLYERLLRRALRRPALVVVAVLILAGGSATLARRLPVELFPSDFQAFFCNVTVDASYGLEQTGAAVAEIEARIRPLLGDRVESFTTSLGSTFTEDNQILLKPNVAQILVYVPEGRGVDPRDVMEEVRERTAELLEPGAPWRFTKLKIDTFKDGPPVGKPVAVRVACPDYGTGKRIARRIEDFLRQEPGVHSISDNLDEGPSEVRVVPDAVRAARAGIPFLEIARLLRTANDGDEIGEVVPPGGDEEVTLRVLLREEDRARVEDLLRLRIRDASGRLRDLEEVARLEPTRGLASRYHYDGERVVLVTADVDDAVTDSETVNRRLIEEFADLGHHHPDVTLHFGGEFEETNRSFASLRQAFVVAVILIFTILAAQFRSYVMPLVVIVVVPFSFVGVILGLWILGFPFTIMAFIAIVGLSGVVVNDSLVLVDFIRRIHRRGGDAEAAVIEGCRTRLRPVVITTVTTVLGLFPMALGLTGYSKVWSPFAATITFGLSLAMLLTLFLVPAVYVILSRRAPRAMNPEAVREPLEAS